MNNIITEKSSNENAISSKIDDFFSAFSIYKILSASNFYKEGVIACVLILKQLLGLVFTGKNLYRTLDMNPGEFDFSKNTAYRFLNSSGQTYQQDEPLQPIILNFTYLQTSLILVPWFIPVLCFIPDPWFILLATNHCSL